jgi:hypothetical protein
MSATILPSSATAITLFESDFGLRLLKVQNHMQMMRKVFGWFFALLTISCLGASILFLRSNLLYGRGILRLSVGIAFCFLMLMAYVFAMAWWSNWKQRPSARAWGIAASLANMAGPFILMTFRHQALTDLRWKILAFSTFALIAFAWPNPRDVQGRDPDGADLDPASK